MFSPWFTQPTRQRNSTRSRRLRSANECSAADRRGRHMFFPRFPDADKRRMICRPRSRPMIDPPATVFRCFRARGRPLRGWRYTSPDPTLVRDARLCLPVLSAAERPGYLGGERHEGGHCACLPSAPQCTTPTTIASRSRKTYSDFGEMDGRCVFNQVLRCPSTALPGVQGSRRIDHIYDLLEGTADVMV